MVSLRISTFGGVIFFVRDIFFGGGGVICFWAFGGEVPRLGGGGRVFASFSPRGEILFCFISFCFPERIRIPPQFFSTRHTHTHAIWTPFRQGLKRLPYPGLRRERSTCAGPSMQCLRNCSCFCRSVIFSPYGFGSMILI